MWNMIWPIIIVVASNCFYNVITKSTPPDVNAFGSLTITYLTAAVFSAILFFTSVNPREIATEISKFNWTSFALGASIVGLEFGYIFIYRTGWKVSIGSLFANISLAFVLLFVGMLLYKETVTIRQLVGMAVCLFGLILISK